MTVDRRTAMGLIGSGAMLPAMGANAAIAGSTAKQAGQFLHGVASGDPTPHGAILWTRVTPNAPDHSSPIPLRWHVAASPDGPILASGDAEARPARDFTVKVDPVRLQAGQDYHYWFELADGGRSPTGRFRTLPRGRTADAVFAVASCQLYSGGFFNAWDHVAKLDRLDAVIHLGDYIYEYGADGYGGEIGAKLGRLPEPAHEVITLADYRTRHAHYKRDPMLQAAHARAAFICVWDDHETANDAWAHGAENHQPATQGSWPDRKAAAMQAYFEWMPIRDAAPHDPWEAINRHFAFGDLATLTMVESRLLARNEAAGFKGETPQGEQIESVLATRNDPKRELIGSKQEQWLEDQLANGTKAGTPWQLIGNQIIMARVNGPDLGKLMGEEQAAAAINALPEAFRELVRERQAVYRAGLPFNLDAWDGYPAARERLYAAFQRAGATPLVLAGDSHGFWANNLADARGQAVGVELGTASISSPSIGDALGDLPIDQMLVAASPEVKFTDQKAKGYILLTLSHTMAAADFIGISTLFSPEYQPRVVKRFEMKRGDKQLR